MAEVAGNIATGKLYLAGLGNAPFRKAKAVKKYKQSNNRHITSSSSSNFLLLRQTAKFGWGKMTEVKRKKTIKQRDFPNCSLIVAIIFMQTISHG